MFCCARKARQINRFFGKRTSLERTSFDVLSKDVLFGGYLYPSEEDPSGEHPYKGHPLRGRPSWRTSISFRRMSFGKTSPQRTSFGKTSPQRTSFRRTSPQRMSFRRTSPQRMPFERTSKANACHLYSELAVALGPAMDSLCEAIVTRLMSMASLASLTKQTMAPSCHALLPIRKCTSTSSGTG